MHAPTAQTPGPPDDERRAVTGPPRSAQTLSAGEGLARLGRGALWAGSGAATAHVLGALSAIAAARLLGPVEFGELSMLRSSATTVGLFAGLGLGATANRHVAAWRFSNPEKAAQVIGTTTTIAWFSAAVVAVLLCLFAESAAVVLKAPSLVLEIRLAAVLVFFSTLSGAYSGILGGLERFKEQAKITMVTAVASVPAVLLGVAAAGVAGGVAGLVALAALSSVLSARTVRIASTRAGMEPRCSWNPEQKRLLRTFALPALLNGLLVTPVLWAGNVILVGRPDGYAELGVFAAANHWRQAVIAVPAILGTVALPILSSFYGSGDRADYRRVLGASFILTAASAIGVGLPLALMSPRILSAYGPEFRSGWPVMTWLLASAVFLSLANIAGQLIASAGKMWSGLALNTIWALLFLASAFFWTRAYGAVGLAGAYAFSYAIHTVICGVFGLHLLRIERTAQHETKTAMLETTRATP